MEFGKIIIYVIGLIIGITTIGPVAGGFFALLQSIGIPICILAAVQGFFMRR